MDVKGGKGTKLFSLNNSFVNKIKNHTILIFFHGV